MSMSMSHHNPSIPHSLIILASCLSALTSNLIKPNGRRNFLADLSYNILTFSPISSGSVVAQTILIFFGWRVSRIADTYSACYLLARFYFDAVTAGKKHLRTPDAWSSIARRAFWLGVTLPCWVLLLRIQDGDEDGLGLGLGRGLWPVKGFVGCLVLHALLVDVFLSFVARPAEMVRTRSGWPLRTFVGKWHLREDSSGGLPVYEPQMERATVDDVQAATGADHTTATPAMDSQFDMLNRENEDTDLCRLIQNCWSTYPPEPAGTIPHKNTAQSERDSARILAVVNQVPHAWQCSHYRCLMHYITSNARQTIYELKLVYLGRIAFTILAVHQALRPFALFCARYMLTAQVGSFITKLAFLFIVDCLGVTLLALICIAFVQATPAYTWIRQSSVVIPRQCRWIGNLVVVVVIVVGFFFLIGFVPFEEVGLSYLVEVMMFPLVVFGADMVLSLVLEFRKRKPHPRVQDMTTNSDKTAFSEEGQDTVKSEGNRDDVDLSECSPPTAGEDMKADEELKHGQSVKDINTSTTTRRISTRLVRLESILLIPASLIWLAQKVLV